MATWKISTRRNSLVKTGDRIKLEMFKEQGERPERRGVGWGGEEAVQLCGRDVAWSRGDAADWVDSVGGRGPGPSLTVHLLGEASGPG